MSELTERDWRDFRRTIVGTLLIFALWRGWKAIPDSEDFHRNAKRLVPGQSEAEVLQIMGSPEFRTKRREGDSMHFVTPGLRVSNRFRRIVAKCLGVRLRIGSTMDSRVAVTLKEGRVESIRRRGESVWMGWNGRIFTIDRDTNTLSESPSVSVERVPRSAGHPGD